jgi:4-hydroxy-3-polyprenylbenzoate decarboxylase
MAYNTIDSFIRKLEETGELIRVKEEVSPYLEIAEINDRLIKNGGKAILFEKTGTDFPVLINMMGSLKRISLALNVDHPDDLGDKIKDIFKTLTAPKDSLLEKIKLLPMLSEIGSWSPSKISGKGICQNIEMKEVDLSKLPILTTWPHDGGPFITFPVVHTISPTGVPNAGMYRMQVLDKDKTGMHWHMHKGGANMYREYKELGRKMPVTVTIGGDPAYIYAATAPLPENIDEYMLAGFLRKKKVKMVKCLTNDIYVPDDVDFVLEGYVDPAEDLVVEGPFGDHTGYYSLADNYPVFHITKITHRKGAVYSATVVGIPPQEDAFIGLATERIFLNPIKMTMVPEINDMNMPPEGVFHNIVISSIETSYPGQALKVMNSLWGAGQMMFNKFLIIVDKDIEVSDYKSVIKSISENTDPLEDIISTRGPMDVLDHASEKFAFGGKMGIDATGKSRNFKNPKVNLEECMEIKRVLEVNTSLISMGISVLIVKILKRKRNITRKIARKLIEKEVIKNVRFVVFMEEMADIQHLSDVVWRAANNTDPRRDCFYIQDHNNQNYPVLFIDATRKTKELDGFERPWPNIVTADESTIKLVDEKWAKYGIGNFIESPSVRYRKQLYPGGAVAE